MARRFYTNTAVPTALTAGVTAAATSLPVASTAGYPAVPFTVGIDRGTASEEVCLATAKTANSLTVTRGYDGTTAVAHDPSAPVEHCVAAIDYDEANAHANSDGVAAHTGLMPKAGGTFSGAVQVPAGTTAAPGIQVGDGNTGLHLQAADVLSAVAGGVEAARFDPAGIYNATLRSVFDRVGFANASPVPFSDYSIVEFHMSSAHTISFTWPTMTTAQIYTVQLNINGAGPITWPSDVRWPDGTAPTLGGSGVNQIMLQRVHNNGVWRTHGTFVGNRAG